MIEADFDKEYLPMQGRLSLTRRPATPPGRGPAIAESRVATVQSLSGTDPWWAPFIAKFMPGAVVYLDPTWGNHKNIRRHRRGWRYRYYDKATMGSTSTA